MVKIALAGSGKMEKVAQTLLGLLKMADKTFFSYDSTKYGTFKQLANNGADVLIAPVSFYMVEQAKANIDVLVFASSSPPDGASLNLISEKAFIIINADDQSLCKYLKGTAANLLTYGYNPKASITASSIEESMGKSFVQLCIQRSFQALNGTIVDAQEIPVTLAPSKGTNILDEIAAITTALALGISLRTISLAY